ncbi:MAG: hypothetical protein ISS89_01710 [Candidatus Omnitrophica bacterium]|nr:hypothetical protein [Candidatus Omnitrophota bacterium]
MKKKSLIELVLTAILIVVLLFAVNNAIKRPKRSAPPAVNPGVKNIPLAADKIPKTKAAQAAMPVKHQYQIQEEEGQKLELKRDPFAAIAPVVAKSQAAEASSITLSGILWDENNPLAIINNKVVKKADSVSGCRVIEIKRNSVVLNDGTRDFELKLGR